MHKLLIKHILVNGADAIYLFNPNSEHSYLVEDINERVKLINLCTEVTGNKTPILVGIKGINVEDVIEQIDFFGKKKTDISFAINLDPQAQIFDSHTFYENILTSVSNENNIYIHNSELKASYNELSPEILKKLTQCDNLSGIIDPLNNINFSKSYSKLVNDNFTLLCGTESLFQKFFQMIPLELRKFVGIVPNLANIVNIPSKMYYCALEEKILEMHQLQEQLTDITGKIYDLKASAAKEERGLKYAFYYIYRNNFPNSINEYYGFLTELKQELDPITKNRIEATINYLINQKQIYKLYFLGKSEAYRLNEIINIFSDIDVLLDQGKIKKVDGPLSSNKNTLYRVNFEKNSLLFRFYTLRSLDFEEIIKEKLLYPLIDHSLDPKSPEIKDKVKEIIYNKKGSYLFKKENPPIIPAANLVYYDETKENLPYIFSVKEFLPGVSLLDLYSQYNNESFNFSKSKFQNLFFRIGEILGLLHQVSFDSFEEQVRLLGKKSNKSWSDLFKPRLELELNTLNKFNIEFKDEISKFFKDCESLIDDGDEPVLNHNDFQWSNIIVEDSNNEIKVSGLIDYDYWGIGIRTMDIVKFKSEVLEKINNTNLEKSFFEGYSTKFKIDKNFMQKIKIYTLYSAIQDFNLFRQSESTIGEELISNKKEIDQIPSFKRIINLLNAI